MYFPKEKIEETLKVLKQNFYSEPVCIEEIGFKKGTASFEDMELTKAWDDYIPFTNGDTWSGRDTHALFRFDFQIPEHFGQKPVVLFITTGRESGWEALNPQFIVWTDQGLKQGIDVNHREILLDECAQYGKNHRILLEGWTGLEAMSCFFKAEAMSIDRDVEALYYDLLTAEDIIFMPKQDESNRIKMLKILMPVINRIDLFKVPSGQFFESVKEARLLMKRDFFDTLSGNEVSVYCTGHSHIDVAWQWEVRHSRKKAVRSFSSAVDHMKQYDDFIFSSSQPQLYAFIKEDHPDFYEQIKEEMKKNHFEAEGAMWVEADCNLISGESFVRQLVHGKRFFNREFGVDSKVLWLPDVFGYSAAMPQILKQCGVNYFVTSKISWNEYNRMPHDLFYWEGIDGSRILTYLHTMPDADEENPDSFFATYNGQITPKTISGTWDHFRDKELTNKVLASYGFGDGGGGPTRKDLEYAKRLKDGMPGVPCVKTTKILPFMEELEKEIKECKRVPKWTGELYLEFHRGTYTSVAGVKKYNRKCEIALHDLELSAVMAKLFFDQTDYPACETDRMWETVLKNQFHDILPGSSIGEVYKTCFKEYEEILHTSTLLRNTYLSGREENRDLMTVYNLLPFNRSDVLIFEDECKSLAEQNGTKTCVQKTHDGKYMAWIPQMPSFGFKTFEKSPEEICVTYELTVTQACMENRFFKLLFDEAYQISSIYDKQNRREVLSGNGNVLRAFEDRPREYDAWEITSYYRDKERIIDQVSSFKILEQGPVRAGIEIVRSFQDSTITQKIWIYSDLSRIDFDTNIDWHEKQLLLKAGFPVSVQTDTATFDIAFGNLKRPVHSNTSWDFAKFEVCAHKWADISERGYGVALMNDCKYGYMAKEGMLELTLLKSASFPYPDADAGNHSFCYSLYPHSGDFAEGRVEHQASMFNSGLIALNGGVREFESTSLLKVQDDNLYIDTVKGAYEGNGVIIRLHEYEGRRTRSKLFACKEIEKAVLCDFLENELEELPVSGNEAALQVKPYEIKTIKLVFK